LLQIGSTVRVALRFYTRRKASAQLWVDDWLVLVGWVRPHYFAYILLELTDSIDPFHDQEQCQLFHGQMKWWTACRVGSREPSGAFETVPQVPVRRQSGVSAHGVIGQMQHLLPLNPHLWKLAVDSVV
jgi:hypothetical protein